MASGSGTRRSKVWDHFELTPSNKVRCLLCTQELSYSNNTSSMLRHLRARHDDSHGPQRDDVNQTGSPDNLPVSASGHTEDQRTPPSGQMNPVLPATDLPLRKRGRSRRQQVKWDFLDLDQSQFEVLHRDLVVLRRSVSRMESRTVPLLRSISKSLARMANALDYITAPGTDGPLHSGFQNHT